MDLREQYFYFNERMSVPPPITHGTTDIANEIQSLRLTTGRVAKVYH